jgi:hypothetical protein
MTEVKQVKREAVLSANSINLAEHARNIWVVRSEYGVTREDIEKPSYWAHIAAKLRPRDRIEVLADGGEFYAEYLVMSCDRTWAKIVPIVYLDLTKVSVVSGDQADDVMNSYEIKHRGAKRWSVIRKSDRAVLQEGMMTEEDCKNWIAVYLKTQGIAA